MAKAFVTPGVCGFSTVIEAEDDASYNVSVRIESECKQIQALAKVLTSLSALEEMRQPINETTPYRLAAECRLHAACPVPCAIYKAMEVACSMALPSDVAITIKA